MKSRLHFFGQQPPLRRLASAALGSLAILAPVAWGQTVQWDRPTYSSPIAVSRNDRLIWSVSPQDHTVAIIRPDSNQVITKIIVGHQPESVALTPDGEYRYVANAADGTVTVLHVNDPAWGTFNATIVATLTTGAEPWNIVCSPDGRRVFVANSSQDSVTVINTADQTIVGHINLRQSLANDPDRSRHFQPVVSP